MFFNSSYLELEPNQLFNGLDKEAFNEARSLNFEWDYTRLLFDPDRSDWVHFDGRPFKIVQIGEREDGKQTLRNYVAIGDRLFYAKLEKHNSLSAGQLMLVPTQNEPVLDLIRSCPNQVFAIRENIFCYDHSEYYLIRLTYESPPSNLNGSDSKPNRFKFASFLKANFDFEGDLWFERVQHVFPYADTMVFLTQTHLFTFQTNFIENDDLGQLYTINGNPKMNSSKLFDFLVDSRSNKLADHPYRTLYLVLLIAAVFLLLLLSTSFVFRKWKHTMVL